MSRGRGKEDKKTAKNTGKDKKGDKKVKNKNELKKKK
jgi:hypothetical protein